VGAGCPHGVSTFLRGKLIGNFQFSKVLYFSISIIRVEQEAETLLRPRDQNYELFAIRRNADYPAWKRKLVDEANEEKGIAARQDKVLRKNTKLLIAAKKRILDLKAKVQAALKGSSHFITRANNS